MTSNSLLWPGMHAALAAARRNPVARLFSFSGSLFILCVCCAQFSLGGESPYTGPGSGALHYYCSSDASQSTIFFGAAFDVAGAADAAKVSDAFKQSIAEEYGYDGDVLCFGKFKTLDAAQAGEKKRVTDLKAANKGKVVETGWTYGGAAAGNATASPPAAPPPSTSPAASAGGGPAQSSTAAQPQSVPAIGTTLAVRILEAVDSRKDPAGKQYIRCGLETCGRR
jgi:hypothetical protein